jgi:glycosyltransferase involved in cell wall biosynthesis
MRIALLGTRGIPAQYGGFETFAEELSARLVERGHKVTVYCRQKHTAKQYRGVDLRYLPVLRYKYFETVAHTAISTLDLLFRRFDIALFCNAANAAFTLWPRPFGTPTVLNVDGLERHRKKWNRAAKTWYLLSEWLATWCCSAVVTDAERIREYYLARYSKPSIFIPYGAESGKVPGADTVHQLGLEPGRYVLYVSRMEPENNALLVREAFEKIDTDFRLALIGDAPYAADYIRRVRDTRDPRIVIPGAIYGEGYKQLQSCLLKLGWNRLHVGAQEEGVEGNTGRHVDKAQAPHAVIQAQDAGDLVQWNEHQRGGNEEAEEDIGPDQALEAEIKPREGEGAPCR